MTSKDKDISSRNKVLFRILAVLLVLLVFALIEIFLRIFSYGRNLDLFTEYEAEFNDEYLMVNPYVGEKYFSRFDATSTTNDLFLKQKPENGVRIFLLGSSTLYGYPYGKNLMASRILQERLNDAYPDKKIEVINTSITAINTVTLKDYLPQVLKQDPDAILLYAGHNEFYGAFGVGSNETMSRNPVLLSLHFKLINLRFYQLIRSAMGGFSRQLSKKEGEADAGGTLMKRIVGDENIQYQGEIYQVGMDQYKKNLTYILEKAGKKNVPVFVSDLVSNVKDLPPFGDAEESGPGAGSSYQEGNRLLAEGDTTAALNLFYRAKDLDPIRFRASEEVNGLIYELVEEYKGILVPVKDWFSSASEGGLIGNNLLTEHVHPNIEGQFLLADVFFSSIMASGLIAEKPALEFIRSKESLRRHWGYTPLDSLMGAYKIAFLKSHWPFEPLDSETTFRDTFSARGLLDSLAFSIVSDPKATEISLHSYLAEYYESRQELPLALKEYQALIAINPYKPEYYHRASNLLLKLNDLHAAETYLSISNTYLSSSFAHALLGDIQVIKSDFRSALGHYNSALDLIEHEPMDPNKTNLLVNDLRTKISRVAALTGQESPSRDFSYSNYIPHNIRENYLRALALSQTDPDSALHYYFLCLEANDCPLVNFRIGDLLYQSQDKEALAFYKKAYPAYKKDPDFLVRYSVAYMFNQNPVKAKEIYLELANLSPTHPALARLKEVIGM